MMFRKLAVLPSSGVGTTLEFGNFRTSYSFTGPVADNNLF